MANNLWDEKYQAFVATLKKLRTDRNINQTDLAGRLGKPQSFVSKYESGERTLDFIETLAVCEILEVSTDELLEMYKEKLESVQR